LCLLGKVQRVITGYKEIQNIIESYSKTVEQVTVSYNGVQGNANIL